jgi:hypothetical protein
MRCVRCLTATTNRAGYSCDRELRAPSQAIQERDMSDQIRELSPAKSNNERANCSLMHVEVELGEEELSIVSGGSLHLMCAKGQHFAKVKLTC